MNNHQEEKSMYKTMCLIVATTALSLLLLLSSSMAQNQLAKTPRDYEGPFYPVVRQQDEDNDLLRVKGREHAAKGDILHLSGRVVNEDGRPVPDSVVEIWQTDSHGRYKDKRDRSPGQRDPDFQYWGKADTAGDGSFSFTTLVPGAYEPRPAHIHFKVWVDGKVRLTSQIYFIRTNMLMEENVRQPATSRLQTVDLQRRKIGEYEAYFQIVL